VYVCVCVCVCVCVYVFVCVYVSVCVCAGSYFISMFLLIRFLVYQMLNRSKQKLSDSRRSISFVCVLVSLRPWSLVPSLV